MYKVSITPFDDSHTGSIDNCIQWATYMVPAVGNLIDRALIEAGKASFEVLPYTVTFEDVDRLDIALGQLSIEVPLTDIPIPDIENMTADVAIDSINAIAQINSTEAATVLVQLMAIEESGKKRKTVLEAIKQGLGVD